MNRTPCGKCGTPCRSPSGAGSPCPPSQSQPSPCPPTPCPPSPCPPSPCPPTPSPCPPSPAPCSCPPPSPPPRHRNTNRVSSVTVTKTPVSEDDPTLSAIMGSVFGTMNYSQFSPPRMGTGRSPGMEGFNTSSFIQGWANVPPEMRFQKFQQQHTLPPQNESVGTSCTCSYALQTEDLDDDETDESIANEKQESLIQWFDRTVESELQKRKEKSGVANCMIKKALEMQIPEFGLPPMSPLALDKLTEASISGIEISGRLKGEPDSDLAEAVDKLAKAEAMCAFAAAVQAAEQAADAAPPELAEEAAAIGASMGYDTNYKSAKETIPGDKPIEVIGYIGITRPKDPKRS